MVAIAAAAAKTVERIIACPSIERVSGPRRAAGAVSIPDFSSGAGIPFRDHFRFINHKERMVNEALRTGAALAKKTKPPGGEPDGFALDGP